MLEAAPSRETDSFTVGKAQVWGFWGEMNSPPTKVPSVSFMGTAICVLSVFALAPTFKNKY